MSIEALLPCPFCGFDADLHHVTHWWVSCSNCEVNTFYEATEAEARAAWNRRGGVQAAHEIISDILSMCDASNWDADGYRGLEYSIRHEVYERLHDFAADWQQRIGALRAVERPADPSDDLRACPGGWQTMESAPTDGTEVWVYVAAAHGLKAFQCVCAYHPDAGWCADELRNVTHWRPLPSSPAPKDREGG